MDEGERKKGLKLAKKDIDFLEDALSYFYSDYHFNLLDCYGYHYTEVEYMLEELKWIRLYCVRFPYLGYQCFGIHEGFDVRYISSFNNYSKNVGHLIHLVDNLPLYSHRFRSSAKNLVELMDYLICLIGEEKVVKDSVRHVLQVFEEKLRFCIGFLKDKASTSNELKLWEYLFIKIHNTVDGIARVLLTLHRSGYFGSVSHHEVQALFMACKIEFLEQELQEAYSKETLELKTVMPVRDIHQELFAALLQENIVELSSRLSSLVRHPQILIIHGELEHLKCFLTNLPKLDTRSQNLKYLLAQIGVLNIKAGLEIHRLSLNGTTEGMTSIMETAKLIRAEIEKIPPLPTLSHFPLTNGLGFIGSLLQYMSALLNSKIDWIDSIKGNVKLAYAELKNLSLFLKKTAKQHAWYDFVDDVRIRIIQVAYKIEHVVDSIMLNDGSLSNLLSELYNVREEAKLINEKIAELDVEMKVGLNILASSQAKIIAIDDVVVGFEEETQTIVDQLTSGPHKLDVISIVGMPGIGKTTLARKVYYQEKIINHFHIRAWCSVSENYDKKALLFGAYEQVIGLEGKTSLDKNLKEDEVADYLRKSLIGNRYLIVLDDMWGTEAWDDFSRLLSPGEENRSRIILTTRLEEVASYAKLHSNPQYLQFLNPEDSWELLRRKICMSGNIPRELLDIGGTILGKCQGLPLMIVLVAGILSRLGVDACQWNEVAKNICSHIGTSEDSMKVIELSYMHLPDYLKPCFLYFGAFKDDEEVSASRLIMLWIAEGFVQKGEQRSLEDVAKDHLNSLISCSLIMVTRWRRCSREAKACRVHDLVREFCLRKAREENFWQLIQEFDSSSWSSDHYRLSFNLAFNYHNYKSLFWLNGIYVRSFLWSSSLSYGESISEPQWIFNKFKLLRILELRSIIVPYYEFFLGIGSLLHLKYLALCALSFHEFPAALASLQNLETLCVMQQGHAATFGIILPRTIWHMVHLRHMNVPLLNLHNYGLEFFDGSSGLENLQSIATVELKYCEDESNILRRFSSLRKLKCKVSVLWNDVEKCYQFPKLDFLHQLESLHMIGSALPSKDHCKFYLPPNLKRLRLAEFVLPWSEISVIPTLANLEKLTLDGTLEDKEWNVEEYEFPNLKFLQLQRLQIVEWVSSAYSFPCLEELVLRECQVLQEVPSCFGEIYTLRTIEIFKCRNSVVMSVMKLKEEIQEIGGELSIRAGHTLEEDEEE